MGFLRLKEEAHHPVDAEGVIRPLSASLRAVLPDFLRIAHIPAQGLEKRLYEGPLGILLAHASQLALPVVAEESANQVRNLGFGFFLVHRHKHLRIKR
ncbi:TPA: hypothetical protein HA225_02380 [Candidatus Micrarchaeota archaeon]|nr:hypothetical protein [Candidatus Micrarchaeota archaeon]